MFIIIIVVVIITVIILTNTLFSEGNRDKTLRLQNIFKCGLQYKPVTHRKHEFTLTNISMHLHIFKQLNKCGQIVTANV